jgi:hypothetical protein
MLLLWWNIFQNVNWKRTWDVHLHILGAHTKFSWKKDIFCDLCKKDNFLRYKMIFYDFFCPFSHNTTNVISLQNVWGHIHIHACTFSRKETFLESFWAYSHVSQNTISYIALPLIIHIGESHNTSNLVFCSHVEKIPPLTSNHQKQCLVYKISILFTKQTIKL